MLSLLYLSSLSIGNFDDLISLTEQNLPNKLSVKELSSFNTNLFPFDRSMHSNSSLKIQSFGSWNNGTKNHLSMRTTFTSQGVTKIYHDVKGLCTKF